MLDDLADSFPRDVPACSGLRGAHRTLACFRYGGLASPSMGCGPHVHAWAPVNRRGKRLEQIARQAVNELAVEAEVVKVTDYGDIMKYNILSTPGLVINEKVVCSGRVPALAEVTTFLTTALMEEG